LIQNAIAHNTLNMKQLFLTILTATIAWNAVAQSVDYPGGDNDGKKEPTIRPDGCAKLYITTSTGINNKTAIMGFNFELPVGKMFTIEAGPGTGTWGNLVYAGVKHYLRPCQQGLPLEPASSMLPVCTVHGTM
jgi:hypothetical protein